MDYAISISNFTPSLERPQPVGQGAVHLAFEPERLLVAPAVAAGGIDVQRQVCGAYAGAAQVNGYKDNRIGRTVERLEKKYVSCGEFRDETICTFAPKLVGNEREIEGPFGYVYGELTVGNHVAYF